MLSVGRGGRSLGQPTKHVRTHTQAQATQPHHRGPPTPIPTAFQHAASVAAPTAAAAVVAAAVAAVAAAAAVNSATRRRALRGRRRGSRESHQHHGSAPCGGRGGPARAALTTAATAAEKTRGIPRRTRRPVTPGYRRWGPPAVNRIVTKVCRKKKPCPAGEKPFMSTLPRPTSRHPMYGASSLPRSQ